MPKGDNNQSLEDFDFTSDKDEFFGIKGDGSTLDNNVKGKTSKASKIDDEEVEFTFNFDEIEKKKPYAKE